ncbi:MAG: hypothetical protein RXO32_08080 [Thermoproteus sp.]
MPSADTSSISPIGFSPRPSQTLRVKTAYAGVHQKPGRDASISVFNHAAYIDKTMD